MPSRPDRWSQYDEAPYRTDGMERVGYDADSQRYYFQEGTRLYEGEPGVEFGGELRHVGRAPPREAVSTAPRDTKAAWRQIAPFLLLIGIIMLLLMKYFSPFSFKTHPGQPQCPEGLTAYEVQAGDSCWSIADHHGWTLDKLGNANPGTNCNPLIPGTVLCVPVPHHSM